MYEPWEERAKHRLVQGTILASLRREFQTVQEGIVFAFPPPAIQGLGTSGGFQMQLKDQGGVGLRELQSLTQELIGDGNAQSRLRALNTSFRATVPQLFVDIDRAKVKTLQIPLTSVFSTLSTALGSAYVNDFNIVGRTYQVRIQADGRNRTKPGDIQRVNVRDLLGNMIPVGTFAKVREALGPQIVNRYDQIPSALITGEPAPGVSSGQAMTIMEEMAAAKMPAGVSIDWTGISFQEKKVGSQTILIFGLGVLLVYLVLAAQYESWTLPAAVIMVVPLALLGTVMAVAIRGLDNNIYTQIGIVLIIALASKNAILIVEFARALRAQGRSVRDAAIESARLRFRPILMTSFAFILGIVPLLNATGAGAASRQALGTAVFGGMLAATILAVFFVPVFYVVVQGLSELRRPTPVAPTISPNDAGALPHAAPM